MDTIFDPYEALPFMTYGDFSGTEIKQDHCCSLMHFIESEKFFGVDERYRKFILSIAEKDDFLLETAGVSQACRRPDWFSVRAKLIKAGLWMQTVQHREILIPRLLDGKTGYGLAPIDEALNEIRSRLSSEDPLRRVLITGNLGFSNKDAVFAMLDSVFANRQADELLISSELGVARHAADYAHQRYIPLRVVGMAANNEDDTVEEALRYASHVFVATHDGISSSFSETCFHAATESGKTAHKIQLELLCA